ncbi:Flagellar L-ring protein [uncultured Desulfobacterium sp.]|uniref:Flagellar L-ring protein n=1 Tax=uncultured Desulfobacterium sp. TaxID=201089 RepID=A0A445MTC2_9BACT|nr:Flagellar L-ring protein [uncultured Desulfobacterium sp.]
MFEMVSFQNKSAAKFIIAVAIVSLLTGCGVNRKTVTPIDIKDDVKYTVPNEPAKMQEGSLWAKNGSLNDLFIDSKARRVGDIITIDIVETASAFNKADTNTSRKSDVSASISKFLGLENNDKFPTSSGFTPFGTVAGTTSNTFEGEGETNRSGKLDASISARVIEVYPNGNLKILGSREITINNEQQYIALTGIVRPSDISSRNTVLSTYISDANIIYTGTGVINDRQKPGWLASVLDAFWPF